MNKKLFVFFAAAIMAANSNPTQCSDWTGTVSTWLGSAGDAVSGAWGSTADVRARAADFCAPAAGTVMGQIGPIHDRAAQEVAEHPDGTALALAASVGLNTIGLFKSWVVGKQVGRLKREGSRLQNALEDAELKHKTLRQNVWNLGRETSRKLSDFSLEGDLDSDLTRTESCEILNDLDARFQHEIEQRDRGLTKALYGDVEDPDRKDEAKLWGELKSIGGASGSLKHCLTLFHEKQALAAREETLATKHRTLRGTLLCKLPGDLTDSSEALAELERQVEAAAKFKASEQQVAAARRELEALQSSQTEVESAWKEKVVELQSQFDTLATEKAAWERQLEESTKLATSNDEERKLIAQQLQASTKELAAAKSQLELLTGQKSDWEKQLEEAKRNAAAEQQLSDNATRLERLELDLKEAQGKFSDLQGTHQTVVDAALKSDQSLKKLEGSHDILRDGLITRLGLTQSSGSGMQRIPSLELLEKLTTALRPKPAQGDDDYQEFCDAEEVEGDGEA